MNYKTLSIFLGIIFLGLFVLMFVPRVFVSEGVKLGYSGSTVNSYDTTSAGFTSTTSTINTTSTNVFASVERVSYIENNTTSTITCSLDASNTTAASSTVASGRGVIVGGNTYGLQKVAFGNCDMTSTQCYRHRGAVNCLANTAAVVSKVVQ